MTSDQGTARLWIKGRAVSDGRTVEDAAVAFEGDRISFAGPAAEFERTADFGTYARVDAPADAVLLPGLVDLHCHGAFGGDFPGSDTDAVAGAVDFLHRAGTTTLLASIVAAPYDEMLAAAERLAGFAEDGLIAGIHAEGPFLSPARCGAQLAAELAEPDPDFVDELVGAARGQLRTMTYAPELEGSDALVEQLASHGVVPSIGHTDADAAQTAASLRLAAEELASAGFDGYTERPIVTHLFNAMPGLHHRSPGPVAACLEAASEGRAVLELIGDGTHLSPDTVRMVFSLVGAESVALVTDSMQATGLPDGSYSLGGARVDVLSGVARLASGGVLAGGTSTLLDVVRTTVASGVPWEDAVTSATAVPAAVLGLADEVGSLHLGFRADVVVVDADCRLLAVYRQGRLLSQPGTDPTPV